MKWFIFASLLLMSLNLEAQFPPNAYASSSLNLRGCGAKGDNTTDDFTAIQNCLDSACQTLAADPLSQTTLSVFVPDAPNAYYRFSKPLTIHCDNLTLFGNGSRAAFKPLYNGGPGIVVRTPLYPSMASSLGAGLLPNAGGGTSNSLIVAESGNPGNIYLNLMDVRGMSSAPDINGATAFTIEANYNSNDSTFFAKTDASIQALVDINSAYEPGFVGGSPMLLFVGPNGSSGIKACAAGRIGTYSYASPPPTNVAFTLCGGTVTQNVTHHIAVSFDGTTVRLFLDGSIVASTTASGSLFVPANSAITIGDIVTSTPDGGQLGAEWNGFIDNVRISNVARYTATFTPPTVKFTGDNNTCWLLTFATNFDIFTQVQTNNSVGWAWLRGAGFGSGGFDSIHDIQIDSGGGYGSSGITDISSSRLHLENISIRFPVGYGIYVIGTAYENFFHNIYIQGPPYFGIALSGSGSTWINDFEGINIDGGVYPMILNFSTTCIKCVLQIESSTSVPLTFQLGGNNKFVFVDVEIEAENTTSAFKDSVYLAGLTSTTAPDSIQFVGGTIEFSGAHAFFDRSARLMLDGVLFHNLGVGTPTLITSDAAHVPPGSIQLIDLTSDTATPWIDNPSIAQGSQLGFVQPASVIFANLGTPATGTPYLVYCSDCKNVADDTTGIFDSVAASGGHGTTVLYENGQWRVH